MSSPPLEFDMEEILKTLRAMCAPGQVVELRALNVTGKKAVCEIFGDLEALAAKAAELDAAGAQGVYLTPNPLRPDLAGHKHGAKEVDVVSRHWLLIDVDATRPTNTSSTDDELRAAWSVIDACRSTLEASGLTGPVVDCSGNGWHLSYPIDLPNDKQSKELVKAALHALKAMCSTDAAKVDTSCHDASRIWRLAGTTARKGENTPERPHRKAFLVEGEPWEQSRAVSNNEALREFVARHQFVEDTRQGRPAGDLITRAKAYLTKIPAAISGEPADPLGGNQNHGHDQTFHVACVLVQDWGLTFEQAFEAIHDWNLRCKPPWTAKDLKHKLKSAIAKIDPDQRGRLANESATESGGQPSVDPRQLLVDRASDIEPCVVQWLWPGLIPIGKLTTFAGVGGLGKTFVLCDITARVTTGAEWPHSLGDRALLGSVLFISGEDDPDDTLVPRLIEMGADLRKVTFLKPEMQGKFSLENIPLLEAAIQQTGSDIRLVVIDPPTAYLNGVDDHKNSELRKLLAPLARLAHKYRVAKVLNTHLNKLMGKVAAMMRVMGSAAWVNAVRAAHLFVRDPDNPERRFFIPMKNNLGPERKGLAYTITPTEQLARVDWIEEVDVTADEAVNGEKGGPRAESSVEEAEEFLKNRFSEHGELSCKSVETAAKACGVSFKSLKDAKKKLNIKSVQRTIPGGGNYWVWIWTQSRISVQSSEQKTDQWTQNLGRGPDSPGTH